jgi:protein TonB
MGELPIEICTDTLRPVRADERVLEGVVEIQPMFPGGNQALQEYLRTNLQRPDEDTTGRVIVTFTIEKDGSITNAKVLKSLSEACDREALRLVNAMPKWAPGKQLGETVSTKYAMPIDF